MIDDAAVYCVSMSAETRRALVALIGVDLVVVDEASWVGVD